jgi:hypothetical protein
MIKLLICSSGIQNFTNYSNVIDSSNVRLVLIKFVQFATILSSIFYIAGDFILPAAVDFHEALFNEFISL